MKRNVPLFVAIALIFATIGIYFGNQRLANEAPQTNVPANLFAQTLNDAQGNPQELGQWKGKSLVVNFWAPWCAPCVEEMPELSALQADLNLKGSQIIGIGIDSAANIAEFTAKYNINYPLYVAGMSGAELSRQLGNEAGGLPFTVLVDANGRIKKTYLGRLNLQELRKDLSAL